MLRREIVLRPAVRAEPKTKIAGIIRLSSYSNYNVYSARLSFRHSCSVLPCLQCMQLLQRITHSGRNVICLIHTPSAKIFAVPGGQCDDGNIVPYMQSIGLSCPLTYNRADFSEWEQGDIQFGSCYTVVMFFLYNARMPNQLTSVYV